MIRSALLVCSMLLAPAALAQQPITLKAAIVALADDAQVRASFEDGLAAKARTRGYDAVPSYDIVADARALDEDEFMEALAERGIQAVLMLRPSATPKETGQQRAIGAGKSLEAVREDLPPKLYADMQRFAKQVSKSDSDDLIAVVHMAIYFLENGEAMPISSGAVWLDAPVESQAQGIDRLQDLVLANVDAVRPAIRQHLRLPPLP